MTSADIYGRISDDRDGDRAGVARQIPDCLNFCLRHGIEVDGEFVDNDISASRKKGGRSRPRPAYLELYARIKAGVTTTVVVWHLDRLYRNMRELEELIDLVEATQVRILTVSGGQFDLNTSDGRAMARVVVAFAMKEGEDKSRRTIRKHLELAEAGKPVGGTRPFGFEADRITIREDEATLIREAADRLLAGETVYGLVADWTARQIPTSRGGRWSQHTFRRMMQNERLIAKRTYKGVVVADAVWPAILDAGVFVRLQAVLAGRHTTFGGFGPRRYLLSGIVFCGKPTAEGGVCGKRLIANAKEGRRRTYVCSSRPEIGGCGGIRAVAEPVEAEVRDRLFVAVGSASLAEVMAQRAEGLAEADLHAEVGELEARLAQLAAMWAAGDIEMGEWVAARQGLERRLTAARRRLVRRVGDDQVQRWAGRADELADWWEAESTTLTQRRAVLAGWIDSVSIAPSTLAHGTPRFDPTRVRISWRG